MDVNAERKLGVVLQRFEVVREFLAALASPYTYNLRRNPYVVFGILWGLPVPVMGYLLHSGGGGFSPVWFDSSLGHPFMWFLLAHPPLFAVVFGAMGTVRANKTRRITSLLADLELEMREIQQAHDELQQLSRLKDEFLGNVTHELKTPLVTIRGYTEMIRNGRLGPTPEPQQRALDAMLRNCARLQQQIDLLLSASRNLADVMPLKMESIKLATLLHDVLERHFPVARNKHVELACAAPEGDPAVHGDVARLTEVFDNLLSNAIKFTSEGGSVTVRIGPQTEGRLHVEIVDTGCGIDDDAKEHIFERFRQADGSIRRKFGGSGLGLSLVKENLAAHGCGISVESRKGVGSTFRFELPLAAGDGPGPASAGRGG